MAVLSSYLHAAFNQETIKKVISSFRKVLKDEAFGSFDGIACRGVSGMAVAPILAYTFNKKLLVIRKPKESCHSSFMLEGSVPDKYIIVDDFVQSGETLESIVNTILKEPCSCQAEYVGAYFWTERFIGCSTMKEKLRLYGTLQRIEELANRKVFIQRDSTKLKYFKEAARVNSVPCPPIEF